MSPRLFGQLAAIQRQPLSANPYAMGTPAHIEWLNGHNEITSDRRRG